MTKEALKLALEWFEKDGEPDHHQVVTAIKEALAQPEQEPVAWRAWVSKFPQGTGSYWVYVTKPIMKDSVHNQPLYTTPPQQEKNEFNPDWDTQAVLVEEIQRMAKRIEELEAKDKPYAFEASMYSNDRVKVDPVTGNVSIGTPQRTWVGLTDEDEIDWEEGGNLKDLVKSIETKLKEKNT
jgi:hypothetical protein